MNLSTEFAQTFGAIQDLALFFQLFNFARLQFSLLDLVDLKAEKFSAPADIALILLQFQQLFARIAPIRDSGGQLSAQGQ